MKKGSALWTEQSIEPLLLLLIGVADTMGRQGNFRGSYGFFLLVKRGGSPVYTCSSLVQLKKQMAKLETVGTVH